MPSFLCTKEQLKFFLSEHRSVSLEKVSGKRLGVLDELSGQGVPQLIFDRKP